MLNDIENCDVDNVTYGELKKIGFKRTKTLGYDGAIHKGNGITNDELEYRIFDKSQIKHLKQVKPIELNWE